MLLNSLYTIDKFVVEDMQVTARVKLDASHDIFKGHFPSQPVLPGVCLIEMLKDLINKAMDKTFSLSSAHNVKYLKVVDPQQDNELQFDIRLTAGESALKVVASSALKDGSVNFKFKGTFIS